MRIIALIFLLATAFLSCSEEVPATTISSNPLDVATEKMLAYIQELPLDSTKIPRSLNEDGSLIAGNSREWTSGFFPGTLWQLFEHSGNDEIRAAAERWTAFIEKEKYDDHTHDLGFKLNCSFGKAYAITKKEDYKDVVITASKTLIERYDADIGSIRSWDWNADVWQFPVIIDNMMNLEMLFDATVFTGDSTFHKIAVKHAMTTHDNHYRADNSCFHVVDYDTTTYSTRLKTTHQGYSDASAWSRGQAWGLYGFTVAYRYTKNPIFLDRAKKSAEFIFSHPNLPEDFVPYWDFDAPQVPNEPRDASAAAVAASALLELQKYVPEQKANYLDWSSRILESLASDAYQSEISPFLLLHSTGSVPGEFEVDQPLVYADYYYIEALLRREGLK